MRAQCYINFIHLNTGISGLVAEYIVAIDVTRVRFPADADTMHCESAPRVAAETSVCEELCLTYVPERVVRTCVLRLLHQRACPSR